MTARRDWRSDAACDTSTPHLLPRGLTREEEVRLTWEAQAICRACPVVVECRHWALHFDYPLDGVVGAFTPEMRAGWRRDVLGVTTPEFLSAAEFLPPPEKKPPAKETA